MREALFLLGLLSWDDVNPEDVCGHSPHPEPTPVHYGAMVAAVAEQEAKAGMEEVVW